MTGKQTCENCRYMHTNGSAFAFCYGVKEPERVTYDCSCTDWKPIQLTEYERGEWEMFERITSVWWGKQMYFLEDDPDIVYSRKSCKHMKRELAYIEFLDAIDEY